MQNLMPRKILTVQHFLHEIHAKSAEQLKSILNRSNAGFICHPAGAAISGRYTTGTRGSFLITTYFIYLIEFCRSAYKLIML
jgi:hypothetical protein